jgi:hypothetical protein
VITKFDKMNTFTVKVPIGQGLAMPHCGLARRCKRTNRLLPRAGKNARSSDAVPSSTSVEEEIPSYFQDAAVYEDGREGGQTNSVALAPPAVKEAPPATSFWSGVPPLVWIGVGVLLGNVVGTALNFVKGGPQKMQEMAMQQMMKQMMKQAGGAPGANPFGAAGASPFGAPGANPFGPAGASPFGAGFPPSPPPPAASSSPTIDTTAAPTQEKKEDIKEENRETVTPSEVKEGVQATSGASKKKSAFVDVDVEKTEGSSGSTSSGSTTAAADSARTGSTSSPPPFTPPVTPPPTESSSSTGAPFSSSMLDMLKDENMQKMLYPYLPEPMRNPQTFEWMLNDPTMRKQLEDMMQGQMAGGAPGAVQDLMNDADMSPDKMQAQFDAMGMDPSDMVSKIMQDPELATLMTKPNVLAAIAECSKDPMAIMKYSSDQEIMTVFEKMSTLFPQAAGGGMPGMGMPPGGAPPS